jgi:hypothetical protein
MPGAQVANFFYLQKIKKVVTFGAGKQPGFFPREQLPRANLQNSDEIFSAVSVHGLNQTTRIIESLSRSSQ